MNYPLWRGLMLLTLTMALSACAAGAVRSTPTESAAVKPTLAFNFPTPTAPPTPTPLPDGPLSWPGGPRPLLMAHYMPWYQSKAISGSWGWHWTMNTFNPQQDANGVWSQFASHVTPLTGLYDSQDDALLEYQVLLMKLSGIDGVIIDWYGMEDFRDYGAINTSTAHLVQAVKQAGLRFVICYEDQSAKYMAEDKHWTKEDALAHGQAVMAYLQETWFGDEAYVQVDGHPLLLTYGPQYFAPSEWPKLFAGLDTAPLLITLDGHAADGAAGSFPWPPMWASNGTTLTQERLAAYLDGFTSQNKNAQYRVGGAFPGFHDIYGEAGGSSYGYLDAQGGKTLRYTLQAALNTQPDMIQLITWNDYGEGTVIEPTVEDGYRDLETVQEARRVSSGGDFAYRSDDLRLPLVWYNLRVTYRDDKPVTQTLQAAFTALVNGQVAEAQALMDGVKR